MSAKARKHIAIRAVKALKPGEAVRDNEVRGFGCRRQRDARVYFLRTRYRGKREYFTIGEHGSPWTPEKARDEAKRILGDIAAGKDSALAREAERTAPDIERLAERFFREHVEAKRKPRTAMEYRALLDRFILPALGRIRVQDVTRADVARLHHSMRATPRQANHALAVLSKLFNWAEKYGYRPDGSNPCRHVEHYPEGRRERFLSEAELAHLAEALAEAERESTESPYVIAAVRLLVFTGARLSEVLNLRWQDVDVERAKLWLPDSKTGRKALYLSAPALQVLADLPRLDGNPHVICGDKPGARLVNIQKPWRRIRARAGLEDVRLHDLRHSFASVAAAGGLSLPMIGKLLGHTQAATTQRYAHLAADPVCAANEAIGQRIAAMMKGGAGSDVVTLPRRKA